MNRVNILTKYIFIIATSLVTRFLSEDISKNFIIIATFTNKAIIIKSPDLVESMQTDADFLNVWTTNDDML